jgi:hypothetical protein
MIFPNLLAAPLVAPPKFGDGRGKWSYLPHREARLKNELARPSLSRWGKRSAMGCSTPVRALCQLFSAALTCAVVAGSVALCGTLPAQELPLPAQHHPWGSFPVGSWKVVRTTTERLDERGNVDDITTTDTKTTLVGVGETSYTLRTDTTIEASGRQLATPPQTATYGFYGEVPGQMIGVQRVGEAELTMDGRSIACELRQVITESDGIQRTSVLHYSDKVAPYILRRETTSKAGGDEPPRTTLVEVVSLDLPRRVEDTLEQAMYVKTTSKDASGTRVTLEVQVEDVPGWVVKHFASERNAAGRIIRRSTLELQSFGLPPEAKSEVRIDAPVRQGRFPRKAARRAMR